MFFVCLFVVIVLFACFFLTWLFVFCIPFRSYLTNITLYYVYNLLGSATATRYDSCRYDALSNGAAFTSATTTGGGGGGKPAAVSSLLCFVAAALLLLFVCLFVVD